MAKPDQYTPEKRGLTGLAPFSKSQMKNGNGPMTKSPVPFKRLGICPWSLSNCHFSSKKTGQTRQTVFVVCTRVKGWWYHPLSRTAMRGSQLRN